MPFERQSFGKYCEHSRDPTLGCLDGEECEHGHEAVVVVEGLPDPLSGHHARRVPFVAKLEVLAWKIGKIEIREVREI